MAVDMTTQSIAVGDNWVKSGNSYVGDQPSGVGSAIASFLASQNTAPNSGSAIWASSQVADGNGSGTFADPYSLRGAIYSAGLGSEVVLKDDGVYQLTNPMNLASDFDDTTYPDSFSAGGPTGGTAWGGGNPKVVTMATAKPTQESERITIRGEQGTLPTIDCQQMRFMSLEFNQFMTFRAMNFINTRDVFYVFEGCENAEFDLIAADMVIDAGGNLAPITINAGTEVGSVTRHYAKGPGQLSDGINANCCGIFNRVNNGWTYQNVTVHNFPLGIYYKHPNDPADVGGLGGVTGLFENVHVYDTDRSNGNNLSCNGYTFRNCLLNGAKFGANGGTGANGIAEGGFGCVIDNVTFFENKVEFDGAALATGGSSTPTAIDSVFANRFDGHPFDAGTGFTVTSSNYNLFGLDAFLVNTVTQTFAQWQTAQSSDANSIQATPSFVGSNPATPSDWALLGSGASASSVGADMGCDVTTIGVMGA